MNFKRKRIDIDLLLGFLLLFSCSIGLIYGDKNYNFNTVSDASITIEEELRILQPFIVTQSVEKIAHALKDVPITISQAIVKELVENEATYLTREDKIQLLYALLRDFKDNSDMQTMLLDIIHTHKDLREGAPILIVALRSGYADIVPQLLALTQKYDDMADIEKRAWYQAVYDDERDLLYQLRENAVTLSPARANELLWIVAERSKHAELVDFFINQGADLTYSKKGHTLLTKATESNNKIIVGALLDACKKQRPAENACKEFVNHIADPLVGSALQIALEKGYTEIELLLRDRGARE